MSYDLEMILELCREIGLRARRADQRVEIDLGESAVLCFQNAEPDRDSLIGFLDTPWHTHDTVMFCDGSGICVELDQLDLLTELKSGHVLICERQVGGQTVDRWLAHHRCNDELAYMQEGERLIIRRAATGSPPGNEQ